MTEAVVNGPDDVYVGAGGGGEHKVSQLASMSSRC
jgi:hypothetical protein